MSRKILFVFLSCLAAAGLACQTTSAPNENVNAGGNLKTVNAADLPPEFSTPPLPLNGTPTPGIPDPANVNRMPQGTTPTPGIPDMKKATPLPKGATPTPGIPSEEELRRQRNQPVSNTNIVNELPKDQKQLDKPASDKLKTVRKPNQ